MRAKVIVCSVLVLLSACSSDLPRISHKARYPREDFWQPGWIEGKRSIQGRINFEPIERGCVRRVRITTSSGREEMAQWQQSIDPNITIDQTEEYTIEILTSISKNPDLVRNEVLIVYSDEGVLVDASICYIHKIPMCRQIEKIVALEDYWPYRNSYFTGNNYTPKLFPNDGKSYSGCSVGYSKGLTWQCPKCFKMSEEWRRQHPIL
jgi:hypothetical protein